MPNNYLDGVTINGTDYELRDASVPGQIANKANDDGYYENMTVGQAEQLISTVGIEDKVPYNFRTAGGTADIGDRENDTVVGGSVAWNQLIENGNFADGTTNWVTATYDVISASNNELSVTVDNKTNSQTSYHKGLAVVTGHKYLFSFEHDKANAQFTNLALLKNNTVLQRGSFAKSGGKYNCIINSEITDTVAVFFQLFFDAFTGTYKIKNVNVFDLTQMFGSTIADYLYTLETATPGAGVAWFKKLFPKPYYEYNAGTLMSVQTSAHNMVGFNAWDEEWANGRWAGNNGIFNPAFTSYVACKNKIPVLPNTSYFFHIDSSTISSREIVWYDANGNWIGDASNVYADAVFTTPNNCYYIAFNLGSNYGTTYNHDICINLSWDGERDGEYEPYELHSYPLDSSLTLRGIPKLDSNNELYYDGDVYEADGTVTRKYGIVDLGTLNWAYSTNSLKPYFRVNLESMIRGCPLICAKYTQTNNAPNNQYAPDKGIYNKEFFSSAQNVIIYDSDYTDAATFKTAMSGVMLVYELATPTTETADPFQTPQIVNDFGTEEYVDAGERDVAIPVGHETHYGSNLRAKLEMLPNSPDGNGDYIVRQTNGINEFVPLIIPKELPSVPSEDGSYRLTVTVANGSATYAWVSN